MTLERTIEIITNAIQNGTITEEKDRALATAQRALEKQIPKKPDYKGDGFDKHGKLIYDTWLCPCCGHAYEVDYDNYYFCPSCGQAIDWTDE